MMKIRCLLVVLVSYMSLCSMARAAISEGSTGFIFTHTHNTHLDSRSQLLSSPLFFQQTLSKQRASFAPISLTMTEGVKLPQLEQRDFSAPISLAMTEGVKLPQLASVCFITDAGNCTRAAGVGTDGSSSSGGGPDWDLDKQQQCINSGYSCTPCQDGEKAVGTCPFDSSCHAECISVCPPENTETCSGPDEAGVGDACGGLYASCCKLCSDYPYDEVKEGYVDNGSCTDCDGKTHYKLKCDVGSIGTGTGSFFDCGESGGATDGETCTDEETGDTYYSECKCPLNQEWNATSKECVCSTSFKYDCVGTNYVKPDEGLSCDGKYSACECQNGFEWDAESGQCLCGGSDFCAMNQDCGAMGYKQQSCSGSLILRCPFDLSYVVCGD